MELNSKLQWSSKLEQELNAITDKNSPSYDKEFTRKMTEKYGNLDNLKGKLKRDKAKQDRINKIQAQKKALLEPNIKNNLIVWVDKFKNGSVYEGSFNKEKCFEIKRGALIFSLKIIHKDLKTEMENNKITNKSNNSTELFKLQEKANKILSNSPGFLEKFKKIS